MRKSYNEIYNEVVEKAEKRQKKIKKVKIASFSALSFVLVITLSIMPFALWNNNNKGDFQEGGSPGSSGEIVRPDVPHDNIYDDIYEMNILITGSESKSENSYTNKNYISRITDFISEMRYKNKDLNSSVFDEDNKNNMFDYEDQNFDYLILTKNTKGEQSFITITRHYIKESGRKVIYITTTQYKDFQNIIKSLP